MIDKEPLPTDEWLPRAHKRKDTKRWCKGKVGVEHTPTVEVDKSMAFLNETTEKREGKSYCKVHADNQGWMDCIHHVACSTCGKELQVKPDICPDTGNELKNSVH